MFTATLFPANAMLLKMNVCTRRELSDPTNAHQGHSHRRCVGRRTIHNRTHTIQPNPDTTLYTNGCSAPVGCSKPASVTRPAQRGGQLTPRTLATLGALAAYQWRRWPCSPREHAEISMMTHPLLTHTITHHTHPAQPQNISPRTSVRQDCRPLCTAHDHKCLHWGTAAITHLVKYGNH
jgi:hypothetical protein